MRPPIHADKFTPGGPTGTGTGTGGPGDGTCGTPGTPGEGSDGPGDGTCAGPGVGPGAGNGGGGCFLTEAVVGHRGLETDDGPTLTALRAFATATCRRLPKGGRWWSATTRSRPGSSRPFPAAMRTGAWIGERVDVAVAAIAAGDRDMAFGIYVDMVRYMEWLWLGRRRERRHERSSYRHGACGLRCGRDRHGRRGGRTSNYSSHDAAFFSDLLSDRVWLFERPNSAQAADRGLVWGIHHGADGTARACIHLDGAWQARVDRWRMVPSPRFRALYNYHDAGTEPDPGHVKGHVPVFYDPDTGRLHSESVGPAGWFVLSLGWVQESWPLALKEACPGLDLPAGLPVNERQTSSVMELTVAQDPGAAVHAHPGSELRAPGATGLALPRGHRR